MKLRHASMVAALVGLSFGILAACNHPRKSNDWRSPSPPLTCTSDADCRDGTCAIEPGAAQGTCNPAALTPLPGTDGGAHPGPGSAPNVQPSSSDIQI